MFFGGVFGVGMRVKVASQSEFGSVHYLQIFGIVSGVNSSPNI